MSDKGGSDLDVFDNLSKAPVPARKKTLVGLAVPPGHGSALGSSARASIPPPPPPSLRTSAPPPPPAFMDGPTAAEAEEIEEIEAVEEYSSPIATEVEEIETVETAEDVAPDIYDDEDATQVFSGFGSTPLGYSDDAVTEEPPTPIASTAASSPFAAPPLPAATGPSLPPPPPPAPTGSSRPLPPPPSILRSSGPPPAPPTPRPPPEPSPPSASEWAEEDDKTAIFNRESGFDAAHMLMGHAGVGSFPSGSVPIGSKPGVPPPPMSRPSAPVPSPPVIGMPGGPRIQSVTSTSVPPAPANRTPLILALMVAVGLGLALFFVLRPTTGGLVVTVAGPGNKPVEGVEVLVDSKVACKASPCTLADLPAGTHLVQARAKGYSPTAEIAVLVTGGQDAVHNIPLAKAAGTGLRVTGTGAGLRVFVDGKDYGPLPQELSELSAGMHTLKVSGEQFETWEKSVTVVDEEMQTIDVPKLKVLKGLAIIKAGDNASGARVLLESDGDRRVLPSLPMNLHIDTTKPHKLVATRKGFETYRQDLVFEDGEAERTFEVELAPQGDDSDGSPSQVNQRRSSRSSTSRGSSSSGSSSSEASSGNGTLNINSIPASNVLLDGRPIGKTPRLGVSVSAGSHTVIFVYEGNRQVKSVTATAGKTSTVVHRFK